MVSSGPLTKKDIESLMCSVFEVQSKGIDFEVGAAYRFDVTFTVQDDGLLIESGYIAKYKE